MRGLRNLTPALLRTPFSLLWVALGQATNSALNTHRPLWTWEAMWQGPIMTPQTSPPTDCNHGAHCARASTLLPVTLHKLPHSGLSHLRCSLRPARLDVCDNSSTLHTSSHTDLRRASAHRPPRLSSTPRAPPDCGRRDSHVPEVCLHVLQSRPQSFTAERVIGNGQTGAFVFCVVF